MKSQALILAAALAGAGAAYAQDVQGARQAMESACAADMTSLCAGKTGRDAGECLRAAGDKVSAGCKDALSKMGGGRGPGGPGGPGAQGARPPRAPPSEGGIVGTVDSVSASSFEVSLPSGAKATVNLLPATIYRVGTHAASASAVTVGQPVLAIGLILDIQGQRKTGVDASQVIVTPPGVTVAAPAPGADGALQHGGQQAAKKSVGNPPSDYVEGSGTIVGPAEADRAIVAALTAYPNGVVNRVVKINATTYEVHHVGVPWPHHVFITIADDKYIGAN